MLTIFLYVLIFPFIFYYALIFIIAAYGCFRFKSDGTVANRFQKFLDILAILTRSDSNISASVLYDLWGSHILTDRSTFINLGYWKNATDLDTACEDMASLLAESGNMNENDNVLDVGFGWGDQDIYWLKKFNPNHITGINITQSQVNSARSKVKNLKLSDRINLQSGSAVDMDFQDDKFDLVTALECAFHFPTREKFFSEAFRVLKPNGRIAIADVIPKMEKKEMSLIQRYLENIRRKFWIIPESNQYTLDKYREKMERVGFKDIKVNIISDKVFEPLRKKAWEKMSEPETNAKLHWLHRNFISYGASIAFLTHGYPFAPMEYIIITGRK